MWRQESENKFEIVLMKESCFVKELSLRLTFKMGKDIVQGRGGGRLFGGFRAAPSKSGKEQLSVENDNQCFLKFWLKNHVITLLGDL